MAIKKATVSKDVTVENSDAVEVEQVPTGDLTEPSALAKVDQPKTVKVTSPTGNVTEVPEGILDALLASGYSKSKK